MAQAESGDKVKVHYTGRLDDGTVFDSSHDRDPLEFTLGENQVISGFEKAVIGMDEGESRTVQLTPDQAYGSHDQRLVMEVSRDQIPGHIDLSVNDRLQLRRQDGGTFVVTVTNLSESKVTLDGNHPLAGQDLTFDIQLVEIV
jgi:peptidylprolyl isomerase